MYSESEVEDYDEYVSEDHSEELSAAELVEKQIEARDNKLSQAYQSYAWTFDDDTGFFRTAFANFLPKDGAHEDRWNAKTSPDCFHAVSALLNSAPADGAVIAVDAKEALKGGSANAVQAVTSLEKSEAPTTPSRALATGIDTNKSDAVGLQPSGIYILSTAEGKPSPASRFLCDNFTRCVLIPVDKAHNRADLRAAHAEAFRGMPGVSEEGLDVVPGYKHTEASGWALPMSAHPDVVAKLKEMYPGWRTPTAADVQLFTKPERSGTRANESASAQPSAAPSPSRRSWTRNAAALMRSKERFHACVEAAGGWMNVAFVAVDVEAFTVTANSIPLPAEYAFVPVRRPRGPAPHRSQRSGGVAAHDDAHPSRVRGLHFFCHPGRVPTEAEETVLFTCLDTHFIPYHSATFLTHDYRTKVRQIDTAYVHNPRVVLINKGSAESPTVMDVQAIRWLYGAALWQQHRYCGVETLLASRHTAGTAAWIPEAEDVHCFDVSVLEAAAAECAGVNDAAKDENERGGETKAQAAARGRKAQQPQCCWYHAVVEKNEELAMDGVHCAQRDAEVLAQRVEAALEKWQPGQSAMKASAAKNSGVK